MGFESKVQRRFRGSLAVVSSSVPFTCRGRSHSVVASFGERIQGRVRSRYTVAGTRRNRCARASLATLGPHSRVKTATPPRRHETCSTRRQHTSDAPNGTPSLPMGGRERGAIAVARADRSEDDTTGVWATMKNVVSMLILPDKSTYTAGRATGDRGPRGTGQCPVTRPGRVGYHRNTDSENPLEFSSVSVRPVRGLPPPGGR